MKNPFDGISPSWPCVSDFTLVEASNKLKADIYHEVMSVLCPQPFTEYWFREDVGNSRDL